jgi:hypothetical protein
MTLASEQVANHIKREGIIVIIRGDLLSCIPFIAIFAKASRI